jgi:hypothetical protein
MKQSNEEIIKRTEELKREREKITEEILESDDYIRGSITEIYKMCSNKECECHSTNRKKHGLAYYISSSHQGKTRMIYVPSQYLEDAKERTENYKKVMDLVESISEINSKIFKLEKKIKKGGVK